MTVHVDELVSEVSVEPEGQVPPAMAGTEEWQALARMREHRARIWREAWRTAAEGYDD
jgi:hypothetical protein